jgi:hypothetical protein
MGLRITSILGYSPTFGERGQPVEKVVVCPLGDPRDLENETETLQIRRIQSLNRGQKSTRRSFSTRWRDSPKFAVASYSSTRLQPPDNRLCGTPLGSNHSDLVAVVAPRCIKGLRLVTMQLPVKFSSIGLGTNRRFAYSGFHEVRPGPLRKATVVPIPPTALETLFVLVGVGHGFGPPREAAY